MFSRYRQSVRDDKKDLETDGGDGGTTWRMCLMPWNRPLEIC